MFDKKELNEFYRYCVVLIKNEDDAYDLLQTALEKYLRSNIKSISSKKSYMKTIIRNQFIDQYRSTKNFESEIFDEDNITHISDGISSLEKMTIDKEEADNIWKLLSSSEREIMYLWAIQGYSTSEVANYLNTPKGTIVSKISRLRKKVVNQLSANTEYGVA